MKLGITGHQRIPQAVVSFVRVRLREEIASNAPLLGVSSLAAGADQMFAQAVLESGNSLQVVIPSLGYEATFGNTAELAEYRRLRSLADSIVTLDFGSPSEEAFLTAGERIAFECDALLAIWDGQPSKGKGGTADIVRFARSLDKPVSIIWPQGVAR